MAFLQSDSNDEYVNSQKNRFKIETLYIVLLAAGLNVIQGMVRGELPGHVIACGLLLLIAALYYMLRSAFSGTEHPNVATSKSYQKNKRVLRKSMITMFFIYLVLTIGDTLLFDRSRTWFDIIIRSIIFIAIFFTLEMVSLKKSYKKNREIVDDSDEKE